VDLEPCIVSCLLYFNRVARLKASNPLYGKKVQKILEALHTELKDLLDGTVNTDLPQFSNVEPDLFGISLMTVGGHLYSVGDAGVKFTIQAICNPVIFAFCVEFNGFDIVTEMMGAESSKAMLSSDKLNADGKPYNLCTDAGALSCVGTLPLGEKEDRYEALRAFLDKMTGSEQVQLDSETYYVLKSFAQKPKDIMEKLFQSNLIPSVYDMEHGLDSYFMLASTLVNADDVAVIGATFAGFGMHPKSKLEIMEYDIASEVNNVMMNCGMFNGASSWMVEVGFPAKASENGAIMAIVPNVCGICVYSPRLDEYKNSVRAVMAMAELSDSLGLHMLRKAGQSTKRGSSKGSKRRDGSTYRGGSTSAGSRSASGRGKLIQVEGCNTKGSVRGVEKTLVSFTESEDPIPSSKLTILSGLKTSFKETKEKAIEVVASSKGAANGNFNHVTAGL